MIKKIEAIIKPFKLAIVVDASICEQVVGVIQDKAKTGKIGDGKIFVSGLEGAIRIRTGESGAEAL